MRDLEAPEDPRAGMNKIGSITPQIRVHTQPTTAQRKTVDTSFGA